MSFNTIFRGVILGVLLQLVIVGGVVYVIVHFVRKVW